MLLVFLLVAKVVPTMAEPQLVMISISTPPLRDYETHLKFRLLLLLGVAIRKLSPIAQILLVLLIHKPQSTDLLLLQLPSAHQDLHNFPTVQTLQPQMPFWLTWLSQVVQLQIQPLLQPMDPQLAHQFKSQLDHKAYQVLD